MEHAMSPSPLDLPEALANVRRAYRLVYQYQRRLCDLLQTVDESLSKSGLAFESWWPEHASRPAQSTTSFFQKGKWAWDLIPAYQLHCEWTESHPKGNVARLVGISAVADSGWISGDDGEPDPSRFQRTEDCATHLSVGLVTMRGKNPDWSGAGWPAISPLWARGEGSSRTVKVGGVEYTHRRILVDVAQLTDAAAVESKLLLPIRDWLAHP
jgi:hypothetical protein